MGGSIILGSCELVGTLLEETLVGPRATWISSGQRVVLVFGASVLPVASFGGIGGIVLFIMEDVIAEDSGLGFDMMLLFEVWRLPLVAVDMLSSFLPGLTAFAFAAAIGFCNFTTGGVSIVKKKFLG